MWQGEQKNQKKKIKGRHMPMPKHVLLSNGANPTITYIKAVVSQLTDFLMYRTIETCTKGCVARAATRGAHL
jgi:hypothetical protein